MFQDFVAKVGIIKPNYFEACLLLNSAEVAVRLILHTAQRADLICKTTVALVSSLFCSFIERSDFNM